MTERERQRRTALFVFVSAFALVLATSVASTARADGKPSEGVDRWVPELGISSGVLLYTGAAGIDSKFQNGTTDVRPPTTGRQTLAAPLIGGELGLMTPGFSSLPGKPRFFVRGGASWSFASEQDVAKEGNPKKLDTENPPSDANLIDGQGSSLGVELKSPVYDAGAGAAFEFDAWGRTLRLRTSVEYMRQRLKVRGKVEEARTIFGLPFFIEIRETDTESFDALGPGIELELDTMRYGSLMTSIFADGRAYHYLGNRKIDISGTGDLNTTAQFKYKLDPWSYRAHVGFRIRWQPL